MAALLVLIVAVPVAALLGHVRAEWALAFSDARFVRAAVTGTSPSADSSRTCTMTQVDVAWPAAVGGHTGHFSVCDDEASRYRVGEVISVAAVPGDPSVIAGESGADAVFGVTAELVIAVLVVLLLALLARSYLLLAAAPHRWRTAPWLPAEVRRGVRRSGAPKGQPVVASFGPGRAPWPVGQDRGRQELATSTDGGLDLVILPPRRRAARTGPGLGRPHRPDRTAPPQIRAVRGSTGR
jgi:hypothetical protein